MEKSAKKTFTRKDVAYLLKSLYFVSHYFSSEQYETYVQSTYFYLKNTNFSYITNYDRYEFNKLFVLAYCFRYNHTLVDDVRFHSILYTYFS